MGLGALRVRANPLLVCLSLRLPSTSTVHRFLALLEDGERHRTVHERDLFHGVLSDGIAGFYSSGQTGTSILDSVLLDGGTG